jgi:hypothetical protein
MMNYRIIFFITACLLTFRGMSEERTYMIPASITGVKQPVISLNGVWQFQFSPASEWTDIRVPGEAAMQGYAIEHDRPFRYRKPFTLPADYRGKTVILRFDGVYSHARLWVNGIQVREHHGGFTRWETDVTSLVKPGKRNEIELEVTDRRDEISYASGYAHHPVGGILRDVSIFALPAMHVYDFHIETPLDSQFVNATLRLTYGVEGNGECEVVYTLAGPHKHPAVPFGEGKSVDIRPVTFEQNRFSLSATPAVRHDLPVSKPQKWDAEHPYLYTLTVVMYQNGRETCRFSRQTGFRDVRIVKDRLLVNGKPVKLRGACRHDMHPELGRTTTKEQDSLDAVLFRQANMNFVRTSHYPCSEKFLDYCDRLGLYVESETAVCFVNRHRHRNYAPGDTQDSPAFADRYLTQFREMVRTFRSHPSVLFWSLGNESQYGSNFRLCREWLSTADIARPVIFSYPGTQNKDERIFDILSMHYPDVQGHLSQNGMTVFNFQGHSIPALFDEWAHVPCYTYATLRDDPNIREFWGMSLDRMWSNIFEARGGLGGAIWGYIDETFALPEPKTGNPWWKTFAKGESEVYTGNCVGYGEWGIVDVWRRLKPEFLSTRKAYSPVRLLTERVTDFTPGAPLLLPVYNRFDHTDLNETVTEYIYRGVKKTVQHPVSVAPHRRGLLTIPGEEWQEGEQLSVKFYDGCGELIDSYTVSLGHETVCLPDSMQTAADGTLTVEDGNGYLTVKGRDFEIPFDKTDGLITNAMSHGDTAVKKGPFLHIDVNGKVTPESSWTKTDFAHKEHSGQVEITLSGTYGKVKVDFLIRIFSDGQMQVDYVAGNEPAGLLRESGLTFLLPSGINRMEWKRKGYWSDYPEKSFAGNEGSVSLYDSQQAAYGEQPVQPWHLDTRNYYYWGNAGANNSRPLTQQAKGMKENCYRYTLIAENGQNILSVRSADASVACRLYKTAEEQLVLYANNRWDYPEIGWGNDCKKLNVSPCYGRITLYLGK